MTPDEWLDSPLNDAGQRVIDRLAFLVGINGSLVVSGWGMIQYGPGPYGRVGLEQEEALELIQFSGIIFGFGHALGDWAPQRIADRVKERIAAQETLRQCGFREF